MSYADDDYIGCPSCGSSVAVVVTGFGLDYAICRYDCGFKWHMLIEPDPDLFDKMGSQTPIVAFEELFDDVSDERQSRILEWSDLGPSIERGSERTAPTNLPFKRKRFFENIGKELGMAEAKTHSSYIQDYIDDKSKLQNVLYVLSAACSMDIHNTSYGIPYKIEYNQFNANAFRMVSPISIEEFTKLLKERENINLIEVEYVPQSDDIDQTPTFTKLYEGVNNEDIKKGSVFNDEFLDRKTSFNLSVGELMRLIKHDEPINPMNIKPIILDYQDYLDNLNSYFYYPSMIDLDNQIVFVSISHKAIMETLFNHLNIEFTDFEDLEKKFHKKFNMIQFAISGVSTNRMVASSEEDTLEFKKSLDKNNILCESYYLNDTISDFMLLNGSGSVSGDIYFPKEGEELDIKGKILVIPTSSEEYFLSALSVMKGDGCIITERGSKTSHLVSNSKEFDFNIILVDNAMKIFKEGESVHIDLDERKIIKL